jgi:DNA repair exonuclease SbcCD ATPase subunit
VFLLTWQRTHRLSEKLAASNEAMQVMRMYSGRSSERCWKKTTRNEKLLGGFMETMIEQPQSMTDRAVSELSQFNDMISGIIHYGDLTVEANGIGQVEEAHKAVKKLNAAIEKKRKELKQASLDYGRTVDSIAKQLTEKVDSVETKLKAERDAFDAIEKAEKAAKESAKVAAKQKRLDDMVAEGIPVDLAAADLPDEEWMWWLSKARKQAAEISERIAEERRQDEAFEAAQRKEREELAAKMAEETKRQAEELRVRAEEIERQRLADEALMAEQRKAIEAEREELRRQQEVIRKAEAEAKAAAEAEAAEQRRKELESEQARKAALVAPELEKLEMVFKAIRNAAGDAVLAAGEPGWCVHLDEGLNKLAIDMRLIVRQGV